MDAYDIDATDWEDEIAKSAVLTVIYFWHEQCPWCFRFTPIFEEVAEAYGDQAKFAKMNILSNEANKELAGNFGIMSTPTLLFLCKGRPVGQTVGLMSKEDLEKGLKDVLARYRTCMSQSTELRPSYIV